MNKKLLEELKNLEERDELGKLAERLYQLPEEEIDDEAREFLDRTLYSLAFPIQVKSFRERVEEFWQAFTDREEELRKKMNQKDDLVPAMDLVSELLKIAFTEVYFEMGYNGRYELILTAEGMQQRLFRLLYWKEHAPEQLLDRWEFTVGRKPCDNAEGSELRMFDCTLCGSQVQVWPELLEDEKIGLNVYGSPLLPLLEEDPNKAYSMMAILIDQCIGEIRAMRHIGYLEIMEKPEVTENERQHGQFGEQLYLHELGAFLEEKFHKEEDQEQGEAEGLCGSYTAYKVQAKEEDWWLREDVFIGNTCCIATVNGYYNGQTEVVEENRKDGVILGFLFYNNDQVEQSEMVPFRAEIEDEIMEQAKNSGQILGGATGHTYSYIDCICYDLGAFLDIAADVMNKKNLEEIGFHVFRQDGGAINLKKD